MIKKEKGIALVSLIITIILMTILASTVVYMSLDRFEINNYRKMINDIELLQDKVSNYYLKYGELPVKIKYNSPLEFDTNIADDMNYYIIDLNVMEGISLNYGEYGFQNPNTSNDVYIINEKTHTIYYVKGIEFDGDMYYSINSNTTVNDVVPPSKPQINIVSGKKVIDEDGNEYYTTNVEIEIVPGKDSWSGVKGTQYSFDGGTTWEELGASSNVYILTENGSYTILAKSCDNASTPNYSSETELTFKIDKIETDKIEIDKIVVGEYVNYDVAYTDMYQGTEYTSTNGWRYLGTDDEGNKLLISTAIPVVLCWRPLANDSSAKWWSTDTTLNLSGRTIKGMLYNFAKIPYTQTESGTDVSTENTAIGRFTGTEVTVDGTTYTAIGDIFKSRTYESKIENVRTLTEEEVKKVNGGTTSGFKDLTDKALGLFDMQDLTGYTADYYYWLASGLTTGDSKALYFVYSAYYYIGRSGSEKSCGVRPVVVLSADVEFVKVNGTWTISSGF